MIPDLAIHLLIHTNLQNKCQFITNHAHRLLRDEVTHKDMNSLNMIPMSSSLYRYESQQHPLSNYQFRTTLAWFYWTSGIVINVLHILKLTMESFNCRPATAFAPRLSHSSGVWYWNINHFRVCYVILIVSDEISHSLLWSVIRVRSWKRDKKYDCVLPRSKWPYNKLLHYFQFTKQT